MCLQKKRKERVGKKAGAGMTLIWHVGAFHLLGSDEGQTEATNRSLATPRSCLQEKARNSLVTPHVVHWIDHNSGHMNRESVVNVCPARPPTFADRIVGEMDIR
jgi:hypothetical protein